MMNPRHLMQLFVRSAKAWSDDYAPSMGAAISYYTVFSLAPLLVIVIAIAGAVFGREAVQGQIAAQLSGLIGQQGATLVQSLVAASSDIHKGLVAGVVSVFVLILGATSVFTELQSSLDRIWHIPPSEKPGGIIAMLRARLLSFGLILGLVFLLMVSLLVSAAAAAFGDLAGGLMPGAAVLVQVVNIVISLGIATVLFAMIYKLLPNTHINWRDVWVGAFTTAVLFEIGKFLIGLYLGKSNMTQSFAAAGSLVVLIAWVYYAAQIFLLGAEFTKVYAQEHGSKAAHHALAMTEATAAQGIPAEKLPKAKQPVPPVAATKAQADEAATNAEKKKDQHGDAEPPLAGAQRLRENRQKMRQTRPPEPVPRSESAMAGASAVAGVIAMAVARHFLHRNTKRRAPRPSAPSAG
ncbi:YihY/virulence factor BrkB family protein [Ramlibacter sp.]|uniref:YihY/virulence factor BrkB family protein n=1 Tax=Ramlibacter sp. TaxID=1917967 RepID=UPI00261D5824|nr:YihY/virulence factor BrkB family protein [Ramlibacter sp.]MDB5957905.1 putative rane protein [Ramlibacter sp.]